MVTGIRHDAMANKYRVPNVVAKTGSEQGKYLYPQGYGITANAKAISPTTANGTQAAYDSKTDAAKTLTVLQLQAQKMKAKMQAKRKEMNGKETALAEKSKAAVK